VTNNQIDIMLIQQLSDSDTVGVDIIRSSLKIIVTSVHFDRENPIERDVTKIEAIMYHANGTGVLIATDSNARSASWHDTLTNTRGRILEEFITSKQLYIMNEEWSNSTFRNHMGTSNIDLTLISPQLIRSVSGWQLAFRKASPTTALSSTT
jgi:hypothetical protein